MFVDVMEEMTIDMVPRTHAIIQACTSPLGKSLWWWRCHGSMSNDGKLKLSEESRMWTLAGDLGRKGKRQETMGGNYGISLVSPFSNS